MDQNHQNDEKFIEDRSFFKFSVLSIIEDYGWYLLLVAIGLVYVYKMIQPTLDNYLRKRSEEAYAAHYHKDPDVAAQTIAAQLTAVQKLQQKYDRDAAKYKEKMEEREAKKREEWLEKNGLPGQKLGNGNKKNESLRPEYNPLMGNSSTGNSYRPQRKSACSGGGCGK